MSIVALLYFWDKKGITEMKDSMLRLQIGLHQCAHVLMLNLLD